MGSVTTDPANHDGHKQQHEQYIGNQPMNGHIIKLDATVSIMQKHQCLRKYMKNSDKQTTTQMSQLTR